MTFAVMNGEFSYPRAASPILTNINVSVEDGTLLAILGPNGAGKTTLIRAMIGLIPWRRGCTRIDEVNLRDLTPQEIGKTIAYVPQARSASNLSLTGIDMVVLGRSPHLGVFAQPGEREREMARETLVSIGAERLADMPCGTMSGGQFQMVLIARALISRPRILVLDEPETGLDFHNQLVVLNLLRELSTIEGLTVVMNTHYPAHALRAADQVLLIDSHHHSHAGPVHEIMTEEHLSRVFDVEVRISDIEDGRERIKTVTAVNIR